MQKVYRASTDRVVFFDNIRYLMVLLVVVLHSACGYSKYTTWWTVNDTNSIFFDYLLLILDIFLMPTLFFISGYFALPSIHKKGTWKFIKSKFIRLGIPWLLGVILLAPVINYIYLYSRGDSQDYWSLWSIFVNNLKGALSLHTGFITSSLQFNHKYFWFISLLIFFFIVFAFLHHAKNRWLHGIFPSAPPKPPSMKSFLRVIFFVGLLTALITFFIYGIFHGTPNRDPWVIIGNLIQFQASRIVLYICCFSLGIYAYSEKLFTDGKITGHFIFWTILSISLMYCHVWGLAILRTNFSIGLALGWVLIRTFLVFSTLLALISLGLKYWNSPSKVSQQLAANSYNIYLLHMIFVVVVQLLLFEWFNISIFIKFGIVTLSAIILNYLISQYAIRPFPKLSIAGMIALFVLLTTVLNPTAS